jgi:uncharacterized membrane protein YphA (DoxX/SURF4 family)
MSETTAAGGTAVQLPATTRARRADIGLRVLQILLALFFGVASALPKLIAHPSATEGFDRIGLGGWFMYLIGSLELAGAIALLIPLLSGLAGLAFIGLMTGAFITQVTVFDGENATTPLIVMVLVGLVAWGRRGHTTRLIRLVSRGARARGPE